jgi:hypothetical protein
MQEQSDHFEQQHGELIKSFRSHFPAPSDLSSRERSLVIAHIEHHPQLKTFTHKGLRRFIVNSDSLPDGRTLCVVDGQQQAGNGFEFYPLVWGSPFGACLRLMLSTRRKTQAVFAVGDHSLDALDEGKIVFAFYRLGRIIDLKSCNISGSQAAFSDFRELISMCKTTHREIVSIDKYIEDATLVRAHSCTEKYFGDEWTRLEWLQHGWIDECQTRSFHAVQRLHDHSPVHAARDHPLLQPHRLLRETANELLTSRSYKHETLRSLIRIYKSSAIVDLVLEATAISDQLPSHANADPEGIAAIQEVMSIAYDTWNLLELDPQMSNWGMDQVSWSHRTIGDTSFVGGESITLMPQGFPVETDSAARFYWAYKRPHIPSDRSAILSPSDFPVAPKAFFEGFLGIAAQSATANSSMFYRATMKRKKNIGINEFADLNLKDGHSGRSSNLKVALIAS